MIEIISSKNQNLIFEELLKTIDINNDDNIILVPDQITVQTEINIIQGLDINGLFTTEVLSFRRFFDRLFEKMDLEIETYVDNQGKMMLMRKILEENYKQLGIFGNAWKKEGFLLEMVKLMDEFRRNEISTDDLEICKGKAQESKITMQKFADIIHIMTIYQSYFEKEFKDEVAYYNKAAEAIDLATDFNYTIWIYGFDGFTSLEYKILKALFEKDILVKIFIQASESDENEVFSNTNATISRIEKIVKGMGRNISKVELNVENKKLNMFEIVGEQYFNYNFAEKINRESEIYLKTANSIYEEIDSIATQIIALTKEKEYRWKDISILVNDMSNYKSIIKRTLKEYGIPYFIDEKRTIQNNSIVIGIISLINIDLYNYRYEDVFKYLKTDIFKYERPLIDALENYVLQFGIRGKKWTKEFVYENKYLEMINELRQDFILPIENFRKKIKKKDKVIVYTKALKEYLEEINIDSLIEDRIYNLRSEDELEYISEYEQIKDILLDLLNQIEAILFDMEIELRVFRNMIITGLAEYEIGVIPTTMDQILVGNIDRIKHRKNKVLFVAGAKDGMFPREFKENGLLLDIEKQIIKEQGLPIFSDLETISVEENMAMLKIFNSAQNYMQISYSVSDIDGKTLRPSVVFSRIKELFEDISIDSISQALNINTITIANPMFKKLIAALRFYVDENTLDKSWEDIYKWYGEQDLWKSKLDDIEKYLFFDNNEKEISIEKIRKLYAKPYKTDISNVQKYIACPFSHFVRYGLKPSERREYLIKAPEIGMFFHSSLEKISQKINNMSLSWSDITKSDIEKIVDETVKEIGPEFANNLFYDTERNKYALKKLQRICQRASETLVEHIKEGEFEPKYFEKYFTNLNLELPDKEVITLEGRIDRIDVNEDEQTLYLKIIDYKSGDKAFKLAEVFYGLEIQLLIYLEAALDMFKTDSNNVLPAGSLYFKIDDPLVELSAENLDTIEQEIKKKLKMTGIVVKDIKVLNKMDRKFEESGKSEIIPVSLNKSTQELSKSSTAYEYETIENLLENTKNVMAEHIEKMLKGNIDIKPYEYKNKKPCDYCEYKEICLFDKKFGNDYRKLKELKDEEILELIKTKCEKGKEVLD